MIMNIVPSINSKTYTLSAIIIGYLLLDEATPAEPNKKRKDFDDVVFLEKIGQKF